MSMPSQTPASATSLSCAPAGPSLSFDLDLSGPTDTVGCIDRVVVYLGNSWVGTEARVLPGRAKDGRVHARAGVVLPLQLRERSMLDLVPVDHTQLPRFVKLFFFGTFNRLSQFQFSSQIDLVDQYNANAGSYEPVALKLWNGNKQKPTLGDLSLHLRPGNRLNVSEISADLKIMPAHSEPTPQDWHDVTDAVKVVYNALLPYCFGWATVFRNIKNFTRVPYAGFLYTDGHALWGRTCPYPVETVLYCLAEALRQQRIGWERACAFADGLESDVDVVMRVLRATLCGFSMCAVEGKYVPDALHHDTHVDDQAFQGSMADAKGNAVFTEDDCEVSNR